MKNCNGMARKFHFMPEYMDFSAIACAELKRIELGVDDVFTLGGLFKTILWYPINSNKYTLKLSNGSDFLLFYGLWDFRKDHFKTVSDFADRFDNCDFVFPNQSKSHKQINLFRILKYYYMAIVWFFDLNNTNLSLKQKLRIIFHLESTYFHLKLFNRIDFKKYSFSVAYYDISPNDNCFIQYCRHLGLTTMTLQHGIFAKKNRIVNMADTGIEFEKSIADFYLAWNQYTKDEAIKAGIDAEKIYVLGVPKYINLKEPIEPIRKKGTVFGVILNSSDFDKHNIKLIQMAEQISDTLGYHYILRYHPGLKKDVYVHLTSSYCVEKDNSKTIADFAKKVSFTIISSSSVFIDLLILKHPTYRLIISEDDTYSNVSFNSFKSVNEIKEYICANDNQEDFSKTDVFKYLCTSYKVYENYKNFFNQFIKS